MPQHTMIYATHAFVRNGLVRAVQKGVRHGVDEIVA